MPASSSPGRPGAIARLLARVGGDDLGRRLAQGAALAFMVNGLGLVANFVSQIVLTRTLGDEGFGVYIYVFGWANLLVVPALLGLNTVQLRYVAVYLARGEWGLLRGLVVFTDRTLLGTGVLCCGLALLVVWQIRDRLEPALAETFWIGLLLVPVLTLLRTRTATVRALGRVVTALAPDMIARPLLLLVGVGALGILRPGSVGPVAAIVVALIAASLALGGLSYARARSMPAAAHGAPPLQRPGVWLTTGVPLLLFEAVCAVNNQAAFLMLGWLGTTTDAGVYAVAIRLASLVAFPLTVVTLVFAPNIADLYARGEAATLQRMAALTARWTTLGALAVGLPLFVFPGFFLSLFGAAFAEHGVTPLRILILGQLANALTGSVGAIMNMTGLERHSVLLLTGATGLNIALSSILIPRLGITGGAIAEASAVFAASIAAVFVVWHRRGILSGVFVALGR